MAKKTAQVILFGMMVVAVVAVAAAVPSPAPPPAPSRPKGGYVFISTDDADDTGHCPGTACGSLYINAISQALTLAPVNKSGILAIGDFSPYTWARSSLEGWVTGAGYSTSVITYATTNAQVVSADFSRFKLIYVPSDDSNTDGGINWNQMTGLIARQPDITNFVNLEGGSLVSLTQSGFGTDAYKFLPSTFSFTAEGFDDVSVTADVAQLSPGTDNINVDHHAWHGYFTGPVGWNGLRVLAFKAENCPAPYGASTNCQATVLANQYTILTTENCFDRIDNDGDGRIDKQDSDCWLCGDGVVDPNEQCDDGNVLDGDGCTATCQFQSLLPPSSPANTFADYCAPTAGSISGCATCTNVTTAKCATVDDWWADGQICQLPSSLMGAIPESTTCKNDKGLTALSYADLFATGDNVTVVGTVTIFRTSEGLIRITAQMNCPNIIWSSATGLDDNNNIAILSYMASGASVATTATVPLRRTSSSGNLMYSCYTWTFMVSTANCTQLSIANVQLSLRTARAFDRTTSTTCAVDPDTATSCKPVDTTASYRAVVNPPPAPSPSIIPTPTPGPFSQTHICVQSRNNQPFKLSSFEVRSAKDKRGGPAVALCTTVTSNACRSGAYCCAMEFAKLEVLINDSCKADIVGTTVNGQWFAYSGDHYNSNAFYAIKFTRSRLSSAMPNPVGSKLCLVVRPGSCSSPKSLCYNGICQASIFSSDNKCCPTWALAP